MKNIIIQLINFYQQTLSPDSGFMKVFFSNHPVCRYSPTCSEYTKQAIVSYGVIKGVYMGFSRLLRCSPLFPGGIDEVPAC